jgi:DNA processing protein
MLDLSRYSPAAQILALKMTGQVGPRTFALLMTNFHTVENIILAEEQELLQLPGIGPAKSRAIAGANGHLTRAEDIIENLAASDTRVVTSLDPLYPDMLHDLNDPPPLLYYQGRLPQPQEKRVALIGSQNVSAEGIADAVSLARRMTVGGAAVVSGLARGIDTAGHMGAIRENGVSYAVLPSGFNQIHPAENEPLAREIARDGGLVSEYLPDTTVSPGRLLGRNRLIVALAHAVVIGEVAEDSVGTLDAALCCQELGKLLFVLLGRHNRHFEKLSGYGAIPLDGVDACDLVLKALV